jgi:hypothetical protein
MENNAYSQIIGNLTNFAQCSTQVVPLGPTPDLSAKFTFITPNLCRDMHSNSCSGSSDVILQGDKWLQGFRAAAAGDARVRLRHDARVHHPPQQPGS